MAHEVEKPTDWQLATAADLMRPNVVVINYATPLSEAARTLSEGSISGAPVVDEGGHIVGILSVTDLVAVFASSVSEGHARSPEMPGFSGRPPQGEDIAGDVMNAQIYSVPADAKIREIARVMTEHRIHRVLVERDGKHVGLITTMEIIGALSA